MSRDLPEKGESLTDLYLREEFPDSRNSKCKGLEAAGGGGRGGLGLFRDQQGGWRG